MMARPHDEAKLLRLRQQLAAARASLRGITDAAVEAQAHARDLKADALGGRGIEARLPTGRVQDLADVLALGPDVLEEHGVSRKGLQAAIEAAGHAAMLRQQADQARQPVNDLQTLLNACCVWAGVETAA